MCKIGRAYGTQTCWTFLLGTTILVLFYRLFWLCIGSVLALYGLSVDALSVDALSIGSVLAFDGL
jgi:hypothetical protein